MASQQENSSSEFTLSANQLRDVLECPVCLKVPKELPVYQCERGHCICSQCHSKLTVCPICRISLGFTRCLIFEKVLAQLPQTCSFVEFGCKVEEMKSQLDIHEKDCPYRVVCCVDLRCHQKVCMAEILHHMEEGHQREDFVHVESNTRRLHFVVKSNDFTSETRYISDHLMLDDRHFFRECCRTEEGQWFVWVYMLGSHKDCEDYIYMVKIFSADQEEVLVYKGRCVPLDVSKEKLIDAGNCLMFPDSTAKRFLDNECIHYLVYVFNKQSSKKFDEEAACSSFKHPSLQLESELQSSGKEEGSKGPNYSDDDNESSTSTSSDLMNSQPQDRKDGKQPELPKPNDESEAANKPNASRENERETAGQMSLSSLLTSIFIIPVSSVFLRRLLPE